MIAKRKIVESIIAVLLLVAILAIIISVPSMQREDRILSGASMIVALILFASVYQDIDRYVSRKRAPERKKRELLRVIPLEVEALRH